MEGTGSRVSQALVLQEGAQVGTVPVDGIGHHPADGQPGSLGTPDHLLAQFGFGGKAHRLRNMSGLPPGWVGAPVFRQIQCAVDEGMPLRRDVGEEDSHLAVLHSAGAPAILGGDADGVAPAFRKAAFIEHQDGKGRGLRWRPRRQQGLADQGTQVIAHGVLVPDGGGEQALDAKGAGLSGLFGDLPAIFAREVTEDGLQVVQGMLVGLRAREVGTQPRMPLAQVVVPSADLTQAWPNGYRYGMLRGLHAVLAFDEGYQSEGLQLLAWHIEASNARSDSGSREISQEDSRENSSFSKCNCSVSAGFRLCYVRLGSKEAGMSWWPSRAPAKRWALATSEMKRHAQQEW